MKIVYPYNEILPNYRAHDVYLFHNCVSLANVGCATHLLCGKGSFEDAKLGQHYRASWTPNFSVHRLPILRKNNPLNLSWNKLFFHYAQRHIKKEKPDLVLTSVNKQAHYHFSKKIKGVKYVFEVHELAWYPQSPKTPNLKAIEEERALLSQADLIVVTTPGLAQVLQNPPYFLTNPIEVVPLAVHSIPLFSPRPKPADAPLTVSYVGQLYEAQGVDLIIESLAYTSNVVLKIIGGNEKDIEALKQLAVQHEVADRVIFYGFQPPSAMGPLLEDTDAFIAPSRKIFEWRYIAHTKLLEYASWERPLIAPYSPVIKEHLTTESGVLFYAPNDAKALAQAMQKLQNRSLQKQLQREIETISHLFTWEKRAKHYCDLLRNCSK